MPLLPVLAFALLLALLYLLYLARQGSGGALWAAAAVSYVLAFLGSFSIGLYVLVITFVLVAVGIARAAGLARGPLHYGLAAGAGVALWALAVWRIDDAWLFLPFHVVSLF